MTTQKPTTKLFAMQLVSKSLIPTATHTHTRSQTSIYRLQIAFAACTHTPISAQQGPGCAVGGAARNAAGRYRCVDSSGNAAACSPGCKAGEVLYKTLGMDVCQEVVNKLGALFFLWLSLQSLVCLWRRVPGCTGQIFQILKPALLFIFW